MISIEQLRTLHKKVSLLVQKYRVLAEENRLLKGKLRTCEEQITEAESRYSTIQEDQGEMEKTVLAALQELDKIEDQFTRDAVVHQDREAQSETANNNLDI